MSRDGHDGDPLNARGVERPERGEEIRRSFDQVAARAEIDNGAGGVRSMRPEGEQCLTTLCALRIEAEGRSVAYTGDTEWTPALVPAARDASLFIAEAYFRDKPILTHLSLDTIEAHLDQLRPKRLILTHMSDDMLNHPDRGRYETADDGMTVTID